MALTNQKIIGRSENCDLSLDHPSVSRQHARVERADDGRLLIQDKQSLNGTFLYRSERWVGATKISLCREDIVRFGSYELKAEQLAALFGPESRVWLPTVPQPTFAQHANRSATASSGPAHSRIDKPRRNPVTGQIEENTS